MVKCPFFPTAAETVAKTVTAKVTLFKAVGLADQRHYFSVHALNYVINLCFLQRLLPLRIISCPLYFFKIFAGDGKPHRKVVQVWNVCLCARGTDN